MEQTNVPMLPGWEIVKKIGSGSFGAVYEIKKSKTYGLTEHSALKIISIPPSSDVLKGYRDNGYDDMSLTALFSDQMKDITAEFSLMSKLKGNSNIVSYEDHDIIPHDDGIGWDILIRMELLTTLPDYFAQHHENNMLPESEVIRIALDLTKALELCAKHNIIHRDIKPSNIFVSKNGDYKLGDFGVAKISDHTTVGTKNGTYSFMAPEVYNGQPYGSSYDIYSLGMVLYWLLNERRGPFLPLPPNIPRIKQTEEAQARRMSGELLPAPAHGCDGLKAIVLKACAPDPAYRYHTPQQMRHDLEVLVKELENADKNALDEILDEVWGEEDFTVRAVDMDFEDEPTARSMDAYGDDATVRDTDQTVRDTDATVRDDGATVRETVVNSVTEVKTEPEKRSAQKEPVRKETVKKERAKKEKTEKVKKEPAETGSKKSKLPVVIVLLLVLIAGAAGLVFGTGVGDMVFGSPEVASLPFDDGNFAPLLQSDHSGIAYYEMNYWRDNAKGQELTFAVDPAFNGRNILIAYSVNDSVQTTTATAADGQVTAAVPMTDRYLLQVNVGDLTAIEWTELKDTPVSGNTPVVYNVMQRVSLYETIGTLEDTMEGWELLSKEEGEVYYGPWQDWTEETLTASEDLDVEKGLVYRSRKLEYTFANVNTLAGWEWYNSVTTEGDWSGWSGWTTSAKTASANCLVESKTQYQKETTILDAETYKTLSVSYGGWGDSVNWSVNSAGSPNGDGTLTCVSTRQRTVYRYNEKSSKTTHYFKRWGEWSKWDTEPIEETAELQVESAELNRGREILRGTIYHFARWQDWTDWHYGLVPMEEDAVYEQELKVIYTPLSQIEQ